MEREPTTSIAASEVLVGAAGAVEVAAAGDVEDAAPHGEVHGHAVEPVVRQQGARGKRLEDDGGGVAGQGRGRGRLVEEVGRVEGYDEEDEVQGCDEAGARMRVVYC